MIFFINRRFSFLEEFKRGASLGQMAMLSAAGGG